jgi:hypothetical protein
MALNYVTLTGTLPDAVGAVLTATLSGWTPDAADEVLVPPVPLTQVAILSAGGAVDYPRPVGAFSLELMANDNFNIPSGTYYSLQIAGINGVPVWSQTVVLNYSSGAVQDISGLAEYVPAGEVTGLMPLPSGTAASGYVPVATGTGEASTWGPQTSTALTLTDTAGALWSVAVSTSGALSVLPVMQDEAFGGIDDQEGNFLE